MGKKSSGIGSTLILAVAIVVLGVALGVGLARYGSALPLLGPIFGEARTQTTTSPVVVEGFRDLDQLATVRWTESVVVTKETGGNAIKKTLTGEKVVLVATGEVQAGVDLSSIKDEDVQVGENRVRIKLPEPELLGSSLDEEKTKLYDRDQGLLRLRPDDDLVKEARIEAEDKILAAANENGIRDTAEQNAESTIRTFAKTLGFEEVEFE